MGNLSPAVIQRLGRRWEAGEKLSLLAESLGITWQVLSTTLVHAGFRRRKAIMKGPGNASFVGDVINFRGFVYGPVNEMGVVALFSKISDDLGFIIEEIKASYPDCIARRRVDRGWERVGIEFEYKSSNFELHGHDPAGCDLIVCWEHDWETCPLSVLSLKAHLGDVHNGVPRPLERVRLADPIKTRISTITDGGIKNGYINILPMDEFWPAECIGDSTHSAKRHVVVEFEGIGRIPTDITERHKKFRSAHREVKLFIAKHRLKPGDQIEIIRIAPYEYRIRPARGK